jgi:hypothetical protein
MQKKKKSNARTEHRCLLSDIYVTQTLCTGKHAELKQVVDIVISVI